MKKTDRLIDDPADVIPDGNLLSVSGVELFMIGVTSYIMELKEDNRRLEKALVVDKDLLRECYLLLERYEESYLGPVALLRQRIMSNE